MLTRSSLALLTLAIVGCTAAPAAQASPTSKTAETRTEGAAAPSPPPASAAAPVKEDLPPVAAVYPWGPTAKERLGMQAAAQE